MLLANFFIAFFNSYLKKINLYKVLLFFINPRYFYRSFLIYIVDKNIKANTKAKTKART